MRIKLNYRVINDELHVHPFTYILVTTVCLAWCAEAAPVAPCATVACPCGTGALGRQHTAYSRMLPLQVTLLCKMPNDHS